MSCPHVAGAVALMLEESPTLDAHSIPHRLEANSIKGAVRGRLKGAPNRLLNVGGPGGELSCKKDNKEFRDAKGFRCWRWRWNWFGKCRRGGLFHRGYTEAQLVDVRKNCLVACGHCGWRFGLPW